MTSPTRPARNRGGRPAIISREQILRAAETFPIEEISMSAVAATLGVTHSSLYKYFPSRAALVAALYAEASNRLEVPDTAGLEWHEWLERAALVCRDHLIASATGVDPLSLREELPFYPLLETFVVVMTEAGFTPEQTFDAYQLFMSCNLGAAILARRLAETDRSQVIDYGDSPLATYAKVGMTYDAEAGFRRELDILIRGLQATSPMP